MSQIALLTINHAGRLAGGVDGFGAFCALGGVEAARVAEGEAVQMATERAKTGNGEAYFTVKSEFLRDNFVVAVAFFAS